MRIQAAECDEGNALHLQLGHGITPEEAEEVFGGNPLFKNKKKGPTNNKVAKFFVLARKNQKLKHLVHHINEDAELIQLWKCANVNAVDRSGISDHGEIHIRIVANAALKMLRLLAKGGIVPSVVKNHGLGQDDAELIVVLAACLHDIGIAVHRSHHEQYSLFLAYSKARHLLRDLYEEPDLTTVTSEVLHAIVSHNADETCLTIEAGVLKVADALDMTEGRSRIPFETGRVNIHSISAQAVDSVQIKQGVDRPIKLVICLANSAGIFQLDELLRHKLNNSSISDFVEVTATIEGETERRILEVYKPQ